MFNHNFRPSFKDVATWETNQWIGRGFPVQMPKAVTILEGQQLKAGSVLGRNSDGKYVLCAAQDADGKSISDGTEVPDCILAENIDTTDGDKEAVIFRTGSYIQQGLTFGRGHSPETTEDTLRQRSIYFEEGTY